MKGTNTLHQHIREEKKTGKNSKGMMDNNQKDVYGKTLGLLLRDNIKVSINQYFFHSY
jgi:hypothetical protein